MGDPYEVWGAAEPQTIFKGYVEVTPRDHGLRRFTDHHNETHSYTLNRGLFYSERSELYDVLHGFIPV